MADDSGCVGWAPGKFSTYRASYTRQPSSCVPLHAQIPVQPIRSPAASAFRRFLAGR